MTRFEPTGGLFGQGPLHPKQIRLLAFGGALFILMSFVVPPLSQTIAFPYGYVAILAIYWICYCIPAAILFAGKSPPVSARLSGARWFVIAGALALPVLVFWAAGTGHAVSGHVEFVVLAILVGAINGPLEEFAWRRPYRSNSFGSFGFEGVGLLMFTLWHVPLLYYAGVSYDFGAIGLLGGAFAMGFIWLKLTRVSGSVGWPAVSHALVNAAAFIPFFQSLQN
ncbi:CPBP family glutamic-type intramembrane protease [Roseobacter weihaiensis]|uniref:CPBP family glutamic-type intramembrane protease n=1 Tax=Roseobacter weihaiensis TaxID=2763262 RepID=UPI001D0ADBD7|nr:CPBP family glutamic-type intramembrane protease [Roseobacter sp. H9]